MLPRPSNSKPGSGIWPHSASTPPIALTALRLSIARLAPAWPESDAAVMKRNEAITYEWTRKAARHPVSIKGGVHESHGLGFGT